VGCHKRYDVACVLVRREGGDGGGGGGGGVGGGGGGGGGGLRSNTAHPQQPLTGIHALHRRLVVRVQRQRPARHAVHAPAVLDRHKVRVVPRHQRHGAVGVCAVEV
jgi:hypothetical protein